KNKIFIKHQSKIKKKYSLVMKSVIENMLKKANIEPKDLTEIVVANGPGSYTGLRIGITTAKTLAYALNIPVYEVSSLKALAHTTDIKETLIVPIFDARRNHVFTGVYKYEDNVLTNVMEDTYISIEALKE